MDKEVMRDSSEEDPLDVGINNTAGTISRLPSDYVGTNSFRSEDQIELGNSGLAGGSSSGIETSDPVVEQRQGSTSIAKLSKRYPFRGKLLGISMIVSFNTSSSFFESTLSPLEGIIGPDLVSQVRARFVRGVLTHRCEIWGYLLGIKPGQYDFTHAWWDTHRLLELECFLCRHYMLQICFGRSHSLRLWRQ
jgi:hypothetical protein